MAAVTASASAPDQNINMRPDYTEDHSPEEEYHSPDEDLQSPGEDLQTPGEEEEYQCPGEEEEEDAGVAFLRTELPDVRSLRRAEELLERLQEETQALEKQVVSAGDGLPPKVSSALKAAEENLQTLETLLRREERISQTLTEHLQRSVPCMQSFGEAFLQVETIEKHMKYLRVLQQTEELSSSVQQCLMTNSVWEAISAVDNMAALVSGLQESKCSHLQHFLKETLQFWHKIIKDRLTSDFEKVLSLLQWPILSPPQQSLSPQTNAPEISSQLEMLVSQLLALQTSDDIISQNASVCKQEVPPLCLPIHIMLQPLSKRFKYHFSGNRQTNSLSKPEWYLTQVLMWISNSSGFLEEKIQPILDRSGANVRAKVELCRGLLFFVQQKVSSDASRLLYDDALFCHLLEELLHFERELRGTHAFPQGLPGVLHLLLDDQLLTKWLTMEKKMALEKVDSMLSSEGAWRSQYKDISDVDELKAPDCAETFMTLLQVITDRYRGLPCASAQLKFLDLQRELVDDFRIRLTQVMKEESRHPLGPRYLSILNAVNYISTILSDWEDNVFFLQLQQAAVAQEEDSVLGRLGLMELGRLASLETTLFESLLSLLERLRADMTTRLLEAIMREVTEKAKPYCHDRWLSWQQDAVMSLSSSACPLMMCVRDRLLQLSLSLSLPLFQLTWMGLAERLDHFIYQEVILVNHFSDGGAAQLQFDMTRNLFPLFGHYCKRPENYFKHVKEACIVLCLSVGSAILLRDLLRDPRPDSSTADPSPEAALNEQGVYCLAPCDVLILLNLRATWPGQ